ncbi:MAG: polysaccharide biosynthesis tyrosine autokinase [Devosia sp.]|nr:polysaccharide biosynthesis tyrosine autokinase [Devosia sp.]
MLRRNPNTEPFPHEAFDPEPGQNELIDLDRIAGIIRRQWKVVLAVTLVGAALGITYLWFATPIYRAAAEVLIDQSDAGLAAQVTGNTDPSQADAAILSQVELIGSPNVAGEAVDKLQLADNAAFLGSGKTLKSQLMGMVRSLTSPLHHKQPATPGEAVAPPVTPRDQAIDVVQANTDVQRVRGTYLLQVSYSNPDPVMATNIANALAEGYLADQLNSKYDATKRASDWLQQRIAELSKESMAADVAVQQFRAANNLQMANGQLLTDQQMAQLNTNLVSAQNATATAKAKVDQINTILASNDPNALVTAALDSPLINALRQHYLDTAKRESDFASLVGEDHVQTVKLKSEMDEYQRQIREELSRIASGDQSDYLVAQAHEKSARDALDQATQQSGSASNDTLAKLNGLESQAASLKNLYELFLQNYQVTAQRTSFPIANARIVAPAMVPTSPSSPVGFLIIGVGTFLGGLVGVGIAGLREFGDRFVRTVDHLRGEIGLEYLGMVPLLHIKDRSRRAKGVLVPNRAAELKDTIYRYAVEHRRSHFAETLRSAKVATDLALADSRSKVLGSISMLPDEGKTTLCYNLASLIAMSGARTLVIDADLRRPTLSKIVAPHCKTGLIEVVLRRATLDEAIFTDPEIGLDVLPISVSTAALSSADLLGSAAFAALLDEARQRYDYVILDLPPVAAVVDARAVSPQVDAFVLVVQWGSTSRQFLQATLNAEPRIAEKCIGTILNKADIKKLSLYTMPGSSEAYMTEYSAYFQDSA